MIDGDGGDTIGHAPADIARHPIAMASSARASHNVDVGRWGGGCCRWARGALVAASLGVLDCGRTDLDGSDWLADERERREREARRCQQVDFLFAIDASTSMLPHQLALRSHYSTFIDGVRDSVERLQTVHVGVIATQPYKPNNFVCRVSGGLIVETGGRESSQRACGPYAEGHNYMTDADDLDDALACALQVGIDGGNKNDDAALSAISSVITPLTDVGNCNHGFSRQDALLVLVILTDTDITFDPLSAFIALAEAKLDRERDVVVISIANQADSGCPEQGFGKPTPRLTEFTEYFTHRLAAPLCAHDFDDVFGQALEVVDAACPDGHASD